MYGGQRKKNERLKKKQKKDRQEEISEKENRGENMA